MRTIDSIVQSNFEVSSSKLASFTGQVISTSPVVGNYSRIMARHCIRSGWWPSKKMPTEVSFRYMQVHQLSTTSSIDILVCFLIINRKSITYLLSLNRQIQSVVWRSKSSLY